MIAHRAWFAGPAASVTVPLSSVMLRSPLSAAIFTVPSVSVTLNSVQALDTGATRTSPAVVATPFDVATDTPPCSTFKDEPSNCTRESPRTVMLEPGALILAAESERVCTRSPAKNGRRGRDVGAVHPGRSMGIKHGRTRIGCQYRTRKCRKQHATHHLFGKQTCPSHAPLITKLMTVNASYPPKFLSVNAFCACK